MPPNCPEKFWAKVDRNGGLESCWLWTCGLGRGGYGKAKYRGRTVSAHRLAWELTNGSVPIGRQLNHSCDNRRCCNPSHLSVGTQAQNIAEAVARGRMARGDRQGLRVHPESRPHGERNGSAKLVAAEVLAIRQSAERACRLAAAYGVSVTAVRFIRARRTWTHI